MSSIGDEDRHLALPIALSDPPGHSTLRIIQRQILVSLILATVTEQGLRRVLMHQVNQLRVLLNQHPVHTRQCLSVLSGRLHRADRLTLSVVGNLHRLKRLRVRRDSNFPALHGVQVSVLRRLDRLLHLC